MSVCVRVVPKCVFIRVETGATGWGVTVVQQLADLGWLHLEVDLTGLRGVAPLGEGDWASRVGAWVEGLPDLADVEVSEDVSLVQGSLTELSPHLASNPIHSVFAAGSELGVVVQADVASSWA